MELQLPSSSRPPYSTDYWPAIKCKIQALLDNATATNLVTTIVQISKIEPCVGAKAHDDLSRLLQVIADYRKDGDNAEVLVIKTICQMALKIEDMFPSGTVEILQATKPSKLKIERKKIHCLLAHMFLGTFRCCPYGDYHEDKHNAGPISFHSRMSFTSWYSEKAIPTTNIYIHALLNLFEDGEGLRSSDSVIEIQLERRVLVSKIDFGLCDCSLVKVNVHEDGRIGDIEETEVDFANAFVGGGPGGTQEELLLGTSPESLPIAILNGDPLRSNECIVITGAKKYAEYRGYGLDAIYTGRNIQNWNWMARKIVAIDALWFQKGNGENCFEQMKEDLLAREAVKCFVGFSAAPQSGISTGHWGCGAFGGDKEVKAILQVIGASVAKAKHLNFFPFGDKVFADGFKKMLEALYKKDLKVKNLWEMLIEEGKSMKEPSTFKEKYDPEPFLFHSITSKLE